MNAYEKGASAKPKSKPRKARAASIGLRRATMTDIARIAGCSQATVSFVLNKASGVKISAETSQRVIEAARSLNYAVASLAHLDEEPGKAPDQAQARFIGFIVDQLATSPEAVVAIDGVRLASLADGHTILIAQTMNDAEIEKKTIRMMVEKGASTLIYMTIFTRCVVLPPWFDDLDLPVILLNCYTADHQYPSVIPSEIAGGQRATEHLIGHRHRRIATITGEPWMEASRDRLKGYRKALSAAGIAIDPTLIVEGNWSASSGYDATRRLLSLEKRPTAIFCQNDRMAVGCYGALKEAGLVIPADMSVIGYDDEEISRHLHPQLTSLVLPQRAMGAWAVDLLSAARKVTPGRFPVTKLDCDLIVRHSVTHPKDRFT